MIEPVCIRWRAAVHSGAEVRIAAAVAHLADLWNMADNAHAYAAVAALDALLGSPAGKKNRHALRDVVRDQLGHHGMVKLFGEIAMR